MRTSIFVDSIDRKQALKRFIRIKLRSALRVHEKFINMLDVKMRDINGEKGGVDKECKIIMKAKKLGTIVVTNRDSQAGPAFRGALQKLLTTFRKRQNKLTLKKGAKGMLSLAR